MEKETLQEGIEAYFGGDTEKMIKELNRRVEHRVLPPYYLQDQLSGKIRISTSWAAAYKMLFDAMKD